MSQNNLFSLLASPLALPTTSSDTDLHTNIMAPIAPMSLTAPAVASYATEIPIPHQPFKYESLCILLAVLLIVAIAVGISRVYEKAKKWREERDADDLEAAFAHASFTPPSIAVPPPSFGFDSNSPSFHAEMEESRNRLTLDVPYGGYVSQNKMLSSNGRGFSEPRRRRSSSVQPGAIYTRPRQLVSILRSPPATPPQYPTLEVRPRYPTPRSSLPPPRHPTLKSVRETPPHLSPARPAINT
ncbi:hypothetical protein DFH09DRAFT_1332981 [Mycena vulgaris]|nr:hypothetical protein DFH09DRAFT_1332981 [Mycena vulgaris]